MYSCLRSRDAFCFVRLAICGINIANDRNIAAVQLCLACMRGPVTYPLGFIVV